MRIEYLYRYPVKGLTAEALESAEVEPNGCIPWDRAFALAQGDSGFDPAAPTWLQKMNFMCHAKNARIAALASASRSSQSRPPSAASAASTRQAATSICRA